MNDQKSLDLGRADRLWLAIQHLKQELTLNQSPNEDARQRAHDLLDRYEGELFSILAKHDVHPLGL